MRAVIAGGGTGGHVFPGVAVAAELQRQGVEILFVGTDRGLEVRAAPEAGLAFTTLRARQVRGGGPVRAVVGLLAASLAVGAAWKRLRRFRPDVVVGVGGYASAPMVVAAWLARVPTVLLEQNVIPGATNRILARFADRVCVSFPESATSFAGAPVVCTGNPVRAEVLAAREQPRAHGDARIGLLVVGGSAGAHHLNQEVVEGVLRLGARAADLRIVHQTGAADEESVRARYRERGLDADVVAFCSDMATAYREADIVIGRAGATTIAELLTLGLPSILVPYPYAADDHQRRNAEVVQAAGAGKLVLDRDLTPDRIVSELAPLLDDPSERHRMSEAARKLARPDAATRIATECLALATERK